MAQIFSSLSMNLCHDQKSVLSPFINRESKSIPEINDVSLNVSITSSIDSRSEEYLNSFFALSNH